MIPASSIHFNDDGTAWLVCPNGYTEGADADWLHLAFWHSSDRPCECCLGTAWSCIVETDEGDFMEDTCPDCDGTGRITFTVEVDGCVCDGDSPPADDCPGNVWHRVSIREGMVLPIVELWDGTCQCVMQGTDGRWYLWTQHTSKAWHAMFITLPPDARPGMWAVLLDIHNFSQNTKETDESS